MLPPAKHLGKILRTAFRPDDLDQTRARSRRRTLLAKMDDKALPIEADQERIWTLLPVACGEEISQAVLGSLRRVAKHWRGGGKCLAAIHLAQTGLPLDADRLQADLGQVISVSPQIAQAGPVHITFTYGGASPLTRW